MKAVLMSIQPKWCELIASGKKTIEVRKTKPKLETPFKVYIYCTQEKRLLHKFNKGERIDDEHYFDKHVFVRQNTWIRGHFCPNGKVIGEFVCDSIYHNISFDCEQSCVSANELKEYSKGKPLYGWHISDLIIYHEPKELSEFKKINRECWYADLGLAKRDCPECKNAECFISRPPQSYCYVEGSEG